MGKVMKGIMTLIESKTVFDLNEFQGLNNGYGGAEIRLHPYGHEIMIKSEDQRDRSILVGQLESLLKAHELSGTAWGPFIDAAYKWADEEKERREK
jgi:hypothetical protein